jgi:hypothetical protein
MESVLSTDFGIKRPWNPLHWGRVLWWLFFTPGVFGGDGQCFVRNPALHRAGSWLALTLAFVPSLLLSVPLGPAIGPFQGWLPLLIVAIGLLAGLLIATRRSGIAALVGGGAAVGVAIGLVVSGAALVPLPVLVAFVAAQVIALVIAGVVAVGVAAGGMLVFIGAEAIAGVLAFLGVLDSVFVIGGLVVVGAFVVIPFGVEANVTTQRSTLASKIVFVLLLTAYVVLIGYGTLG